MYSPYPRILKFFRHSFSKFDETGVSGFDFHLDMTQLDKYGIPKLTVLPHQTANKTLAYPYKVRVVIKGTYEGKIFEADLGGFDIAQKTSYGL